MVSAKIDKSTIVQVAKFNVKKFFTKPIKVDALLKTISELLSVTLDIDNTPCIIEAHFNEDILFIEIARGLNTEKIEMLKYKITELLELYEVKNPKVLIMMSNVEITSQDSLKLGALFTNILEHSHAKPRFVKVLTNSDIVEEFLSKRKDYEEIEVTKSLEVAMDGLLGRKAGSYIDGESRTVHHDFLTASAPKKEDGESINLKFEQEEEKGGPGSLSDISGAVTISAVDDDIIIQELIKTTFSETSFTIKTYNNGKEFLTDKEALQSDLVFLDLMMPEVDGFQVLKVLKQKDITLPIIVLSALSKQETVVKALQLGINSYLIKPLKPEIIIKKTTEILKMNF
jgi:DNA-binding response OmpR family regulator